MWEGLGRADRAESVTVAAATRCRARPAPRSPPTPRWTAAALLHDVGKQASAYGPIGRSIATVVVAVVGGETARGWAGATSGVRGRIGRYAAHDELGAELSRVAGARPAVVAWAGAHHRPDRWDATGIPPQVCRALAPRRRRTRRALGPPGELRVNRGADRADRRMCRTRPRARTSSISTRPRPRRGPRPSAVRSATPNIDAPRSGPEAAQAQDPRPPGVDLRDPRWRRWFAWASTTPGGPSARIGGWIDHMRGVVAEASVNPDLRRNAAYFNSVYATQGSYPNPLAIGDRRDAGLRAQRDTTSTAAPRRSSSRA